MGRLLRFLRRVAAAYLLPARRVTVPESWWSEGAEDYGCCALGDHTGPCAYRCSDCDGFGSCLACSNGCGCDDVVSCTECNGNHYCVWCDDGLVYEDGF